MLRSAVADSCSLLAKLEELADAVPEVSQTRPLPLDRRLAGSIDNVGEVLAIAEGEDYR